MLVYALQHEVLRNVLMIAAVLTSSRTCQHCYHSTSTSSTSRLWSAIASLLRSFIFCNKMTNKNNVRRHRYSATDGSAVLELCQSS